MNRKIIIVLTIALTVFGIPLLVGAEDIFDGEVYIYMFDDNPEPGPSLLIGRRARGVDAAEFPVLYHDQLLLISGEGWDGDYYSRQSASIIFRATEDFAPGATGGEIRIRTTENGTDTPTDRMRITHNGYVGIGTTAPKSALQVEGYVQLDLTTNSPPAADCDDPSEYGRMKVDATNELLYICVASGWTSMQGRTAPTVKNDFNGDGTSDVLIRHTNGTWYLYLMNADGLTIKQGAYMPFTKDLNWQLADIGDYNGDGTPDVLVRHTNGTWYTYLMNADGLTAFQGGYPPLTKDLNWQEVLY